MFNSKKTAAVAAVLGSFALMGVGAVQASAHGGPGTCVESSDGHVRCVQMSEYQVIKGKGGDVTVVNHSTQTCPTSHSQVSCVDSVALPVKGD
ncbi:hypothetical protein ABZ178_04995 [Streptomyces massasporeus]|uniref:hypothetical protein n=1 Tax=Streptomyces massasporeus TaxID=67324 RepID=UPI001673048A|nr:hypothetical protein [Streptomyces massasporeus]GGV63498.1 hypothetical protein GCM10010228_13420 [Streptomyces massasporeus]